MEELYSQIVRDTIRLPMPDGVRLATDIYRPTAPGKFPALLLRVPYDRRVAQTRGYAHPRWYASRGFVVAVQDVRGRYASDGDWEPFVNELDDGAHTAQWLAEFSHCSGQVGLYGYSYPGAIQVGTAAQADGAVNAIAPGFCSTSIRDDWAYPGGVLALGFCLNWAIELARGTAQADADYSRLLDIESAQLPTQPERRLGRAGSAKLGLRGAPWPDWELHQPTDPYWDRYRELMGPASVPGLFVGGWYDLFVTATLREARATPASTVLIGPWWHAPWVWSTSAASSRVDDRQLEWFRHHLRGDSLPERGRFEVFVLGADAWLTESVWPPTAAHPVALYLHSGGRANTRWGDGRLSQADPGDHEPPDVAICDPLRGSPVGGGHSCCDPSHDPMGPADQANVEDDPSSLVYTSEPWSHSALLLGNVTLDLHCAAELAGSTLVAMLTRVTPDGISTNLLEGIGRVPAGLNENTQTIDGDSTELRIGLGETCVRLEPGDAIRLDLSAHRYPQWDVLGQGTGPKTDEVRDAAAPLTTLVLHTASRPSALNATVLRV